MTLLAGSLLGAWLGATWATRMASATCTRDRRLLVVIAWRSPPTTWNHPIARPLDRRTGRRRDRGRPAIGIIAALMGAAGGELLIPTIVLLYAVDLKLAGSLSLAVSLPTMLVAFARYSRDGSFVVLRGTAASYSPSRQAPSPEPSSAGCCSA